MAVLVDEIRDTLRPLDGQALARWSATRASSSCTVAAALGIPRRRFQRDHYDLPPILRARAVAQGAEQVTISDLAQRMAGPRGERNRARRARRAAGPASVD